MIVYSNLNKAQSQILLSNKNLVHHNFRHAVTASPITASRLTLNNINNASSNSLMFKTSRINLEASGSCCELNSLPVNKIDLIKKVYKGSKCDL